MATVTVIAADEERVSVPPWVVDVASFRRWTESDGYPESGRTWWLRGEVWVDMSREQIFTHLALKGEIHRVLANLAREDDLGLLLPDGLLLSNFAADISGNPDATFLLTETLRSDRVRLIEGASGGFTEIQGAPDMVLEVVSASSVSKDTRLLKAAYWDAGIPEYWLVDARKEPLKFDILRYAPRGYLATRKTDGWLRSQVFGRSFRLTQRINALGHPEYTLSVR